ncbi:unnamed protein product [Paramecium sonneborni]|uniref:MtA protein n=1 Tax=Paramecium sonneborni TaxID=65129 RepID=A0A8S1JZD0_9CILI|nr:unnamed protein product [Paramecium sonneborni]
MLILLLLVINQVNTQAIESKGVILEQPQSEDLFSIIFEFRSTEKINKLDIYLNKLKCLETSTIIPIIKNNKPNPYTFELDLKNNILKVYLEIEKNVFSQQEIKFEATQFYYPTYNQTLEYNVLFESKDSIVCQITRNAMLLQSLQITQEISITQDYQDLNIQFINYYKNHLYDVIVIKFIPTYPFDLSFQSCEGIQNIGKNLNCWKNNNNIYIQQKPEDFIEKNNQNLIKLKIKGFLNPYYIGKIKILVLIQPIQFLDTSIISSYFYSQYEVKSQKNKQVQLSQSSKYINSISQIELIINTLRFNKYLQLELYIPNQSTNDLIFKSNDNNMKVNVISTANKEIQLLKLTINEPQTNYDIKLLIENYQNPAIPSEEKCLYFLTETFNTFDDPLQIQYGKGILSFIPNYINLIQIQSTNNYITKSTKATIKFGIDINLSKDCLLNVKFNQNLNTSKISSQNQVVNENTLSLYGVFSEQKSEYTIEFNNIINPIVPSKFNYVDLEIIYFNNIIASNQNQIEVEIIPEILTLKNINLDYIIANSYTTFKLEINFNVQHPYLTNIEIQFDPLNINFNQITKQIQCFLDNQDYICQIHQTKLTIFGVGLTKNSILLEILYFPYPKSIQPLIIESIRQFNNSNILLQTDQTYLIQPKYCREFNQFQIQLQQIIQQQELVPINIGIMPSQDILENEFLIFVFDNNMIIENDVQCQINSYLVNIECELKNEQIKIKIVSGSLIHNMSYSILINKVKILGNLINFKLSAFTQNNFLQQQSQYTHVKKQQSQSSEFLEFTFDPIDSEYSAQSSYNLFFENAINIPAQGYLKLSAAELNINFLSGQVIKVSGNEDILNQKIIKQDQKYSLLFYFEKEVFSGMHLFRLQNISNPLYKQKKDYYNFQLESYDQNNNLLEYKQYDLYFIFVCPQSKCLICNQQDYCDKCDADYVLYQGQCLKECPIQTVLINNQCQRCNSGASCLVCSNVDTVLCIKCNDGYDLINGFCIWTTYLNQTQSQNPSNNITNNSNVYFNKNTTIQTNQTIQTQLIFDVHIFAIIVLSSAIIFILRNIFQKKTDFQNAYLAFSGLSDFALQFISFLIIIINYTIFQSIISLTLCFLTIFQQLYAYKTIKHQLQVDSSYQKYLDSRFAQILRFLTLYIDWKVIFIHKSSITNSKLFSIEFQNEIRILRLIFFFFLIKISINIVNLGMLGIILITQDQIAQLIYESIFYNLAMILIQLNKMYQIKLTLKNYNHQDILIDQINIEQNNQEQQKITAKVTPESMIIQQD